MYFEFQKKNKKCKYCENFFVRLSKDNACDDCQYLKIRMSRNFEITKKILKDIEWEKEVDQKDGQNRTKKSQKPSDSQET